MQYRYFICDVFTTRRFGGNPLAVLPDAEGLDAARMQQIAREFNYSESTFVFARGERTRQVRIFTPTSELPFAGHPNIGTAFVLAQDGRFGAMADGIEVIFEEAAGDVSVSIRRDDRKRLWCELQAPQSLTLGEAVEAERVAAALFLDRRDIVEDTHPPQVAGVGLPFLIVELAGHDALQRARANLEELARLRAEGIVPHVHLYVRSHGEFDIQARMFAPLDGVAEDPATGSANCALAAMLTHYDRSGARERSWCISQGVAMGRPSVLNARTRRDGASISTWIGGHSVLVSEGTIYVD